MGGLSHAGDHFQNCPPSRRRSPARSDTRCQGATAGAGLPLGRCPTIGLAGVTLGGGLSAFTRQWGLACDHLREIEIVTADGRIRRVRPDSPAPDSDLFWALCGGGGG